jgi:hypothetical protein
LAEDNWVLYPTTVWLAGISLSDDLVVELAKRLQRDRAERTAQVLLSAAARGRSAAVLDSHDRKNILAALDNPPPGLEELRGALLKEHGRPGRKRRDLS